MDSNKPQVNSAQVPQRGGGQTPQPTAPSSSTPAGLPVQQAGPSPLAEVSEASQPALPVEPQKQPEQPVGAPQPQAPAPGSKGGTIPQTGLASPDSGQGGQKGQEGSGQ